MKKYIYPLFLVFIVSSLIFAKILAVTIDPETDQVQFISGDICYVTDGQMNFSLIQINNTWIGFNDTVLNINASNNATVILHHVSNNISNVTDHSDILNFSMVTNNSDIVEFNLSGFTDGYVLYIDLVFDEGLEVVNNSVFFNNSSCNGKTFLIIRAENYDVSIDTNIDYLDTGATALVYGSDPWYGREDINEDNKVNYLDTGEVALHYGESYSWEM